MSMPLYLAHSLGQRETKRIPDVIELLPKIHFPYNGNIRKRIETVSMYDGIVADICILHTFSVGPGSLSGSEIKIRQQFQIYFFGKNLRSLKICLRWILNDLKKVGFGKVTWN